MKRFITFIFLVFVLSEIFGQRPSLTLTFSAVNNTSWVQLDSIRVMNRTQGGDTVLYYPDTVLVLDYQVGISEPHITVEGFQVFQNYPNPAADHTTIDIYVPSKDKVRLTITDVFGRVIIRSERLLDEGLQSFRFVPGDGSLYFFTVQWRECSSSIKILQANLFANRVCSLEYQGSEPSFYQLKVAEDIQSFPFSMDDELLYICYMDTLRSGVIGSPEDNKSITFQFATNIPCPGTPTVDYEGQVYNTIQIYSQCWLKENLNAGTMIQGDKIMSDNDTLEKYCYRNEADSCAKYGGLYQWWEVMQYSTQPGTRGICPPGWHIPNDEEWKILEGVADSQYGIGDNLWDIPNEWRGYDVGKNLQTMNGWNPHGNGTDLYGFSALPSGFCLPNYGNFGSIGYLGYWWSSTPHGGEAWSRFIDSFYPGVGRFSRYIEGFSVRCLKDD